eukprot:2187769-Rhodomonas_salina.4
MGEKGRERRGGRGDHGDEDVVVEGVGLLAVEDLEAQGDVEAHKLVGHALRAHAHGRLWRAVLQEHGVEHSDVAGLADVRQPDGVVLERVGVVVGDAEVLEGGGGEEGSAASAHRV